MQLLLQVRCVRLQLLTLCCQPLLHICRGTPYKPGPVRQIGTSSSLETVGSHLSNTFVDIRFFWKRRNFTRRQLQDPTLSILCCNLGLDYANLLLRESRFLLNLLQ